MKIFVLLLFVAQLFGSFDPYNGQNIQSHFQSSWRAKISANNALRAYTDLGSLLIDERAYGLVDIEVVDFKTLDFIDAKSAFFVYKSHVSAAYGRYSLIAFANKADANSHVKRLKGEILDFEAARAAKVQSAQADAEFMQNRYKKRAFFMGEKLYEKNCPKDFDVSEYLEIGELMRELKEKNICGPLEDVHLEALGLYLWHIKRKGDLGIVEGQIELGGDEKCPVCGMFIYKYPKWAAQIVYKHGDHEHTLSFDGVKDMLKFYHQPQKWGKYPYAAKENITNIKATDYYSSKAIDATRAYYVIGSNIYGPMGHEAIPFASKQDAQTFKKEHNALKILDFKQLSVALPYNLDVGNFAE